MADTPAAPEVPRIVVISPTRNEEATLPRTVASMEAQTLRPLRWILVDDGSTDRTPELMREAAARLPWVRVVTRPDRGYRKLGGGVIEAFDAGRATIDVDHDFIAKLDVDMEFEPTYLERIMKEFASDPKLAAASGKVFRREEGRLLRRGSGGLHRRESGGLHRRESGGLVEEFIIDEMVAGQFKLYRRDVFEKIGGFVREVMWDGIDIHRVRMAGFKTRSFADPELRLIHLRVMGSTDKNVYRGRLRWGRGQWFMGSSFPYVVASGLFRMRERPYVVGGLLIIAGYLDGLVRRVPRYGEPEFRRELRRWQRERLRRLFTAGALR
jgi:poly-beta-1,6-N-acetyl-D-glucosamine synthase